MVLLELRRDGVVDDFTFKGDDGGDGKHWSNDDIPPEDWSDDDKDSNDESRANGSTGS
jgi:hypothetical protein